ncbi:MULTISPECIES: hypothetical protein [unclassified Streptomyces]|uniref:hypothetical protein n=1 Tax=unclassified Streptomyces TaxID=2593676 RepID=UPI001F0E5151|nr:MULTISPECIES: hypothetical protein [unclassified Streptomyces]
MSVHALAPRTLLAAFAVTTAGAWCAAGRRRGPLACAAGMPAAQAALHATFSLTGAHQAPATGHGTHAAHGTTAATPDTLLDGGVGMLAAHLLAALVCGLWLARGEAAFFALAEGATRPLRRLFAAPPGPVAAPGDPRRPVRRPRRTARRPHVVVLASVLSRRGPPHRPRTRATALGPLV